MKTKHLKNKTIIELTPEETTGLIKQANELDRILSSIFECQDLWLSDIGKLETLKYKIADMLDLIWDSETYSYRKN